MIQSELRRNPETPTHRRGSNHMHSREIENHKLKLRLSSRQKEILVGKMLGDGHLETQDHGQTYRLKVEHSFQQKAYVDWLYREFKTWVRTPPKAWKRGVVFRGKEHMYQKYGFQSLSTGSLRFYAAQFYRNGKKIVPRLIHRWLTPMSLAVWYMDDGSVKSKAHRTVFLNTQSFDRADVKRLQTALFDRFGIVTQQRIQGKGRQIYLRSETVDRFLCLIEPFILPSLRYKIPKVWLTSLPKK